MTTNNPERQQKTDREHENKPSTQASENDRKQFRQDQGWSGSDQTSLGSLGVSDYDSEFRSGRGSFNDRDTDYDGEVTLDATLPDREQKHNTEEVVEKIQGVNSVQKDELTKKASDKHR